jgi:hypothetical protein
MIRPNSICNADSERKRSEWFQIHHCQDLWQTRNRWPMWESIGMGKLWVNVPMKTLDGRLRIDIGGAGKRQINRCSNSMSSDHPATRKSEMSSRRTYNSPFAHPMAEIRLEYGRIIYVGNHVSFGSPEHQPWAECTTSKETEMGRKPMKPDFSCENCCGRFHFTWLPPQKSGDTQILSNREIAKSQRCNIAGHPIGK